MLHSGVLWFECEMTPEAQAFDVLFCLPGGHTALGVQWPTLTQSCELEGDIWMVSCWDLLIPEPSDGRSWPSTATTDLNWPCHPACPDRKPRAKIQTLLPSSSSCHVLGLNNKGNIWYSQTGLVLLVSMSCSLKCWDYICVLPGLLQFWWPQFSSLLLSPHIPCFSLFPSSSLFSSPHFPLSPSP